MPPAATESVARPQDSVFFELDRLEMAGDDRLELSGRWYGVRGRRFVRPTLRLLGPAGRRRALADLEHKPWAAEDGEAWTAAFPWELDALDADDLELAVAPDIAVAIPSPGASSPPGRSVATGPVRVVPRQAENPGALHDALELARAEIARLRVELERTEAAQLAATSALARRDAAIGALAALEAERDDAVAACDAALAERDDAVAACDAALAERDDALQAFEQARRERDQAVLARDATLRSARESPPAPPVPPSTPAPGADRAAGATRRADPRHPHHPWHHHRGAPRRVVASPDRSGGARGRDSRAADHHPLRVAPLLSA